MNKEFKIYTGVRDNHDVIVRVNGRNLSIEPSQRVHNHSEAYEWGYGGSGPSQLALAIMLDIFDEETAACYYQKFKFEFIACAKFEGFVITSQDVENWLAKYIRDTELRGWDEN